MVKNTNISALPEMFIKYNKIYNYYNIFKYNSPNVKKSFFIIKLAF